MEGKYMNKFLTMMAFVVVPFFLACDGNSSSVASDAHSVSCAEQADCETIVSSSSFALEDMSGSSSLGKNFGTLTDPRDGKTYKTVVIGKQTWMAENLNYYDTIAYPNLIKYSWCYGDSVSNCDVYGRLYTWEVAMDSAGVWSKNGKGCGCGKSCSPTYPVQGICPSGWHLPSKREFEILLQSLNSGNQAIQLKSSDGWDDGSNGTDDFGFRALPAGRFSKQFGGKGSATYFWSSTQHDFYEEKAYDLRLVSENKAWLTDAHTMWGEFGKSVRCVKD